MSREDGRPSGLLRTKPGVTLTEVLPPLSPAGPGLPTPGDLTRSKHGWQTWYRAALFGSDVVAAFAASAVSYVVRQSVEARYVEVLGLRLDYPVLAAVAVPVWVVSVALAGGYRTHESGGSVEYYRIPVTAAVRLMALVAIASFALKADVSRLLVVAFFPALIAYELLLRYTVRQCLRALHAHGRARTSLLLVGSSSSVQSFADHLVRSRIQGYEVVGACVAEGGSVVSTRIGQLPVVGEPDDVVAAVETTGSEAVAVVGPGHFSTTTVQTVAWDLERANVDLMVAPDVVDMAGHRIRVVPVSGLPLLQITTPRVAQGRQLKGLYERALAVPLLVLAAPALLAIALAIRLESRGRALCREERVGPEGRAFAIIKFRTTAGAAEVGADSTAGDAPLTRVGRWLAGHSLDHLPQLLNVVRGDMVLIGPRPYLREHFEAHVRAAEDPFIATSGLTGVWQVSGRIDLPRDESVLLDEYYVENWSVVLDLMILYRTIRIVVSGRNQ